MWAMFTGPPGDPSFTVKEGLTLQTVIDGRGGELPVVDIPFRLRPFVSWRQPGEKREARDAGKLVPEACNETRGGLGDLDKRAMTGVLFVREPGVGRSSLHLVLVGVGVPGGPEQGLAR